MRFSRALVARALFATFFPVGLFSLSARASFFSPRPTTPPSAPRIVGDAVYTFSNGQKATFVLSGENAGVYWGDGTDHRLLSGPTADLPPGARAVRSALPQNRLYAGSDHFANRAILVSVGRRLYVLTQDGRAEPLQFLAPLERDQNIEGATVFDVLATVAHRERRFVVIKVPWARPIESGRNGQTLGEYFVVREDGVWTRLSLVFPDDRTPAVSVEDGVLKLGTYFRRIDLDAFELEASFNVPLYRPSSGDGDANRGALTAADAFNLVKSLFPEVPPPAHGPQAVDPTAARVLRAVVSELQEGRRSPVIVGEPGSGKSYALDDLGAFLPRTWHVFDLLPDSLNSGSRWTGTLDSRISAMKSVSSFLPVIWRVKEIHNLRGLGRYHGNENDFLDRIKTEMAEGFIRFAGDTTREEFQRLASDGAIRRRFRMIDHPGYTDAEIDAIIGRWCDSRRFPRLAPDVLAHVRAETARFDSRTAEPARTLNFLATYFGRWRAGSGQLDKASVPAAAQDLYGGPLAFFDHDAALAALDALRAGLDRDIRGNPEAKEAMFNAAAMALLRLTRPGRILASGLFAGPRGAGKTAVIASYARHLGLRMKRIEMNQYSADHDVERFLVAVGEFWQAHPFGVILFDEPDKASLSVQNAMLAMLESGEFTYQTRGENNSHRSVTVSVLNGQVFFATNAGEGVVIEVFERGHEIGEDALRTHVETSLSRYLVDRLDFVRPMYPSTLNVALSIARRDASDALASMRMRPDQIENFEAMTRAIGESAIRQGSNRAVDRRVTDIVRTSFARILAARQVRDPQDLQNRRFHYDEETNQLRLIEGGWRCEAAFSRR